MMEEVPDSGAPSEPRPTGDFTDISLSPAPPEAPPPELAPPTNGAAVVDPNAAVAPAMAAVSLQDAAASPANGGPPQADQSQLHWTIANTVAGENPAPGYYNRGWNDPSTTVLQAQPVGVPRSKRRYDYARAAVTTGPAVSASLQPGVQPPLVPPTGPPVSYAPPTAAAAPAAQVQLEPPSVAHGSTNETLCTRLGELLQRVDRTKMLKRAQDDMDTRVQALIAALSSGTLVGPVRERTSELILAIADGQYPEAREIIKVLVAHHSFAVEGWLVGLKRILHELDPAGAAAPSVPSVPMQPPIQPMAQPAFAGAGFGGGGGEAVSADGYTNYDTYVPPTQQIIARNDDESTLDSWHNWASSWLAPPSAKDTLSSIGK